MESTETSYIDDPNFDETIYPEGAGYVYLVRKNLESLNAEARIKERTLHDCMWFYYIYSEDKYPTIRIRNARERISTFETLMGCCVVCVLGLISFLIDVYAVYYACLLLENVMY